MIFRLSEPVRYRGREYSELRLRQPTVLELRKHYRPDRVAMVFRVVAAVAAIPRQAVEHFTEADIGRLAELLLDLRAED